MSARDAGTPNGSDSARDSDAVSDSGPARDGGSVGDSGVNGDGLQAGARVAAPAAKPVVPVILLAVAAAGLWASSRMTWVTVQSADGLTEPRTDNLDGGTWFGALTPLALVLVAAIAAVFAVKGVLRQLLGVVVAVVAAVAAVPGFALTIGAGRTAERAGTLAELPGRATVTGAEAHVFPAVLSVLAAACALAAGVLLTRRAETTAQLSGKYDNPVFRRADASAQVNKSDGAAPLSDRVLWDALDAGTDPTDTADTPDDDDRPGRREP